LFNLPAQISVARLGCIEARERCLELSCLEESLRGN
jgi:hypothetical protein